MKIEIIEGMPVKVDSDTGEVFEFPWVAERSYLEEPCMPSGFETVIFAPVWSDAAGRELVTAIGMKSEKEFKVLLDKL